MTITLNLDSEKEERLRRQAAQRGQEFGEYLLSLADRLPEAGVAPDGEDQPTRQALPQGSPEWKALLRSMGQGRTGVGLSLEATSRESIYEDDLR